MTTTAKTLAPLWRDALEGARRCRLEITSERITETAALRARLAELAGTSGWLCTTGRVESWTGGAPERFLPLAGELVVDENTSVQLRQIPGGWLVTRLQEHEPSTEAEDLAFDEDYESTAPGREGEAMRYRIYHRRDEQGVYRPVAARFTGWSGEATA